MDWIERQINDDAIFPSQVGQYMNCVYVGLSVCLSMYTCTYMYNSMTVVCECCMCVYVCVYTLMMMLCTFLS